MLSKLKHNLIQQLASYLSDVRNIGTVAFGIIAVLVTWSGVKVVQTNYDLQKQISAMQQENEVKKLENANLKLKNQYLNTSEYLELAARRHFNKASPGEKLLIVPKNIALAHSVEINLPKSRTAVTEVKSGTEQAGPWYERNFNAWIEFLFHRQES